MKPRAAVILIQHEKIALIERHRSGRHYFVFPGGKIKPDEAAPAAAAREAREELGLEVRIGQMVAEVWYMHVPQYYFLAEPLSGQFGSGTGTEMNSQPNSEKGSYHPVWMPVAEIIILPVLPRLMAEYVQKYYKIGWPVEPFMHKDSPPDQPV